MAFYIQYDPITGVINATNETSAPAPVCDHQLVLSEWAKTSDKKVDLATLTLVDAPVEEVQ